MGPPAADPPLVTQAKEEIGQSLAPLFAENPKYEEIFENMVEPEYIHQWKAVWEDDQGVRHVNRCWRVQQCSALGPYKGGLRFDSSVTVDTLRFLALEQTLKNSLTGKAIGGAKGGSDFSPRGKSDAEIRRFCEQFMIGLRRVIGPDTDVPAGDIGVGGKVIGFLYGAWRKFGGTHSGVLTGKGLDWGGSKIRTEATGYGVIYLLQDLLSDQGESLRDKKVLISGSGNVATYAVKKAVSFGANVLSMSDRKGTYWCDTGFALSDVDAVLAHKASKEKLPKNIKFFAGSKPWNTKPEVGIDIAIPCATQNEISEQDAKVLVSRGANVVCEGSNMSSTAEAVEVYKTNKDLIFVGAKLANLGGVGTSFLEMEQNAVKSSWTAEEVDDKLQKMMSQAYKSAKEAAARYDVSLTDGANIASFLKVAGAMQDLGYA